jgi:hypothetical protein
LEDLSDCTALINPTQGGAEDQLVDGADRDHPASFQSNGGGRRRSAFGLRRPKTTPVVLQLSYNTPAVGGAPGGVSGLLITMLSPSSVERIEYFLCWIFAARSLTLTAAMGIAQLIIRIGPKAIIPKKAMG